MNDMVNGVVQTENQPNYLMKRTGNLLEIRSAALNSSSEGSREIRALLAAFKQQGHISLIRESERDTSNAFSQEPRVLVIFKDENAAHQLLHEAEDIIKQRYSSFRVEETVPLKSFLPQTIMEDIDVDETTKKLLTHFKKGDVLEARMLISELSKEQLNQSFEYGFTPLMTMLASDTIGFRDKEQLFRDMQAKGADIFAKDEAGHSVEHIAKEAKVAGVVQLIKAEREKTVDAESIRRLTGAGISPLNIPGTPVSEREGTVRPKHIQMTEAILAGNAQEASMLWAEVKQLAREVASRDGAFDENRYKIVIKNILNEPLKDGTRPLLALFKSSKFPMADAAKLIEEFVDAGATKRTPDDSGKDEYVYAQENGRTVLFSPEFRESRQQSASQISTSGTTPEMLKKCVNKVLECIENPHLHAGELPDALKQLKATGMKPTEILHAKGEGGSVYQKLNHMTTEMHESKRRGYPVTEYTKTLRALIDAGILLPDDVSREARSAGALGFADTIKSGIGSVTKSLGSWFGR